MVDNTTRSRLLEAQWAIVGAMLVEPDIVGEVIAECRADDFLNSNAREIFVACRKLYTDKKPVDPVTALHILGDGFRDIIRDAMITTPTAANWRAYAEVLREDAKLSRVQALGQKLMGIRDAESAAALMQQLSDILCDKTDTRVVSLSQGFDEFYARHSTTKRPDYIQWGLSALNDKLTAELGDIVVIGARPSAGKTMMAGQMAIAMAKRHPEWKIGIFSFETKDQKLYDRVICHLAGVSFNDIKQNSLDFESWKKISEAAEYRNLKIDVINAAGMTVSDIKAETLAKHYNVIFIDYIQLVAAPWHRKRFDAVTEISLELKQFAQAANVAVVELAQLSRPEKYTKQNMEPRLSDLRESGQIEQDADIAMLLYAVDPDDANSDRKLFIAKNKDGPLGRMTLGFDPDHMTFLPRSSRTDEPVKPKPKPKPEPSPQQTRFIDLEPSPFDKQK